MLISLFLWYLSPRYLCQPRTLLSRSRRKNSLLCGDTLSFLSFIFSCFITLWCCPSFSTRTTGSFHEYSFEKRFNAHDSLPCSFHTKCPQLALCLAEGGHGVFSDSLFLQPHFHAKGQSAFVTGDEFVW